nr:ABC transporter substrate-binding protein [Sneathiella chinensis]
MNLCTDQLAVLIARPEQIASVSFLSHQKISSVLVREARRFPANRGTAEEIFRLQPDLVTVGRYSAPSTVHLLKRLGMNVVTFEPARDFPSIRENIRKMGTILHRQEQAEKVVAAFDASVRSARDNANRSGAVIGSYAANGYSTGGDSLESALVEAAGFRHLGTEQGRTGSIKIPLESLLAQNPDYLLTWDHYANDVSRATAVIRHPALQKWFTEDRHLNVPSRYWVCGAPFTATAIHHLIDATGKPSS